FTYQVAARTSAGRCRCGRGTAMPRSTAASTTRSNVRSSTPPHGVGPGPRRATRPSSASSSPETASASSASHPWSSQKRAPAPTPQARAAQVSTSGASPAALSRRATASRSAAGLVETVPQREPSEVEDVVMGTGFPEGPQGFNTGRNVALLAGLPVTVPGGTVSRFCSSGLNAVMVAAHMVQVEGYDVIIGGGLE